MRLLPDVLPCQSCRSHAYEFVSINPPEEAKDLKSWLQTFRSTVAARKRMNSSDRVEPRRGMPVILSLMFVILLIAIPIALFAQR